MAPLVLGINAAYHESAAALVRGAEVVLAVEEERFSRVKHAKPARHDNPDELPWAAIGACLEAGGAGWGDLDAVVYAFAPGGRLETVGLDPYPVAPGGFGTEEGEREFDRRVRSVPALLAAQADDPDLAAKIRFLPHHVAHAGSAFYASPWDEAAVLVVDGIGERATGWLGRGRGAALEPVEELPYPHSIGLLWERFAVWLGWTDYDAAKVMGLAAYGDPGTFGPQTGELLRVPDPDGGAVGGPLAFEVDARTARFRAEDTAGLEALFGPPRRPDEDPTAPRFADVAAALQRRTEEALLALARRLHRAIGGARLTYAGGVALNCVANARIEREGPYAELYVQGAAHDAGTALGAALHTARGLGGAARPAEALTPFLGPDWSEADVAAALAEHLPAGWTAERLADPPAAAAGLLAEGALLGWFGGRLELGPRALGHRSLLGDPRTRATRSALNERIKHREPFRPFAAAVLAEAAGEWLDLPAGRPGAAAARELMVLAYPVRPEKRGAVPAVVHADGTCRVQLVTSASDPRLHALLAAFAARTGVPLVLNTSFNDREPIVASPADALRTFLRSDLDALVLGDRLVRRPA